jgi:pimeloyl-ACP methyl ester carboxylesterase
MRTIAGLLLSALLLVGCAADDSEPVEPSAAAPPSPTVGEPVTDLHVECTGDGEPTVVMVAGLDTSGVVFNGIADRLSGTTRTCWYDRAGIGDSAPLADGAPEPTPGSAAADLRASLASHGVDAPYVVLGWSYGGLVAQAYALAYPEDLSGLVLEDTSVRAQFTDPEMIDDRFVWSDGGREVDTDALVEQLSAIDFGNVPLAVLSQDSREPWAKAWLRHHDELARASTEGVHVVGVGSGHVMHEDVPDLLVAAVEAVWAAAAEGSPLGTCDARFTDAGGRCRKL